MGPFSIQLIDVCKVYSKLQRPIPVLRNVNLEVRHGEFLSIMGPSGVGKTTLLNIVGCLDTPTSGKVIFDGGDISAASDEELSVLRNNRLGFVFQTFNLIPYMTVYENVGLPFSYSNPGGDWHGKVVNAIRRVGLAERMHHKPNELSGGEMQRASIARAIVNDPAMILADEPTGNLDSKTGQMIMEIFKDLSRQSVTIVLITHDKNVAAQAQRMLVMRDGEFVQ